MTERRTAYTTSTASSAGETYSHTGGASLRLSDGLVCPRCSALAGVTVVQPYHRYFVEDREPCYLALTVPIFRCKTCRHAFAPLPPTATASAG